MNNYEIWRANALGAFVRIREGQTSHRSTDELWHQYADQVVERALRGDIPPGIEKYVYFVVLDLAHVRYGSLHRFTKQTAYRQERVSFI